MQKYETFSHIVKKVHFVEESLNVIKNINKLNYFFSLIENFPHFYGKFSQYQQNFPFSDDLVVSIRNPNHHLGHFPDNLDVFNKKNPNHFNGTHFPWGKVSSVFPFSKTTMPIGHVEWEKLGNPTSESASPGKRKLVSERS